MSPKDLKDKLGGFILLSILGLLIMALLYMDLQYSAERDQLESRQQAEEGPTSDHSQGEQASEGAGDKPSQQDGNAEGDRIEVQLHQVEGELRIQLEELAKETGGSYKWDQTNGVLEMKLFNIPFNMIKEVPVVERNGLFLPFKIEPLFREGHVFLPLDFLTYGLDVEPKVDLERQHVIFTVDPEVEVVFTELSTKPVQLEDLTVDEIIDYLSFLTSPIPAASISTRTSHLPGARRAYRNGYHEGIDWYSGTTGRRINRSTPVVSVADGIIVRADYDYIEMDREEREGYLSRSKQLRDTPTFILDKLRGCSVWVQYDQGVSVRYVHLSKVEEGILVGTEVKRGDTLGYVGNSGTSFAIDGNEHGGLHLHMDLLIYGELFWQYVDQPSEVRRILESVF
jgi:murein DD-endopeptidase MepM/ murein hydrolase activator NlpD